MSAQFTFFFIAAALLVLGALFFRMYRRFRGWHEITCPETEQPAEAKVNAALAAGTWIVSQPRLVVTACSRWPARTGCAQSCRAQIEADAEKRLV